MRLNKIIQRDYTSFSLYYQIKLPLDLEISIPSDDPVRLVSAFVEEMDLSELYKTYGRIRKNQATPRQMLKLVIYAAMNESTQVEISEKHVNGISTLCISLKECLLLIMQRLRVLSLYIFLPAQRFCLPKCQICSIVRRHTLVGTNRTLFSPDPPTRLCRAGTYRTFLPAWRHVVAALFERQHCCF